MKATSLRGLVIMAVLIFMSVGAIAQTTIAGWDFNGLIKSGSAYNGIALPATTTAGGLTTGGLFRGNSTFIGFAAATVANYSENAYGGYPTNLADSTTAIAGGKYIYFKVQAGAGNTLSLSNFQMYYRVQPITTAPTNVNMKVLLQYSVGSAAFQSIEQIAVGSFAGPSDQLYTTSLSTIAALQTVSDSIRFRLVVYGGANASPGASFWLSNGATGNDLLISGTVGTTAPACATITPGTISSSAGNSVCPAASSTLSLNGTTPVTGVNYQWMSSATGTSGWSIIGSNSNTCPTGNLSAITYYKCIISCATGTAVDSTPVYTLAVTPSVTPAVSISSNNTTICNGGTVTLTATPTNGGAAPTYSWKDGTATLGSTSVPTFTTAGLATGPHNLTCTITSNAACVSPATATSAAVTVTANAAVTLGLFITNNTGGNSVSSPLDTACAGTSVLFTANQVNGGTTPSYTWKKGSTVFATTTHDTITISPLNAGDVITCVMTSSVACPSTPTITSASINMYIKPAVVPVVTIAGPTGSTACQGVPVTFTATPTNGGSAPSYAWYKGTTAVGTGGVSFLDNSAANGDVVTCIMTSNASCAVPATDTSNAVTMTVTPSVTPVVTIASAPGTSICQGTSVTYTATPTNGGTIPSYTWYKGTTQVGGNTISYTDNGIANGDLISCIMATTATCATKPTDTSNIITMAVNPVVTPTVAITANPGTTISAGQTVTFTATVTNGGTTPVYQWKKNGVNVGTNANTYVSNAFVNGDSITCMVHSTATCANPDSVKSNKLVLQITTGIHQTANANGTVNLFPNPNSGSFTITGSQFTAKEATLEVTNIVGQVVYKEVAPLNNGTLNKEVVFPSAQASGVYILRIRTENTEDIIRFVVN